MSDTPHVHDDLRKLVGRLHVELVRQRALVASVRPEPGPDSTQGALPPSSAASASVRAAYASTYRGDVARLALEAVRTRSLAARSLLASVATGNRLDDVGLAEFLETMDEAGGHPDAAALAQDCDPAALLALARVLFAQCLLPGDARVAVRLYDFVTLHLRTVRFSAVDWINFLGLLIAQGHTVRAERLLLESGLAGSEPYEYACLRANLQAAATSAPPADPGWLAALNTLFELDGIEPLALEDGEGPPIDRIACMPARAIDGGPLVSVLMSNYGVGETVRTAVAAVLNQSWRRLELIIVDDCSPGDEFEALRKLEDVDPRVKVHRTAANAGTYTARNLALAHASGEFVTCHDADDWSHPRKIETQVSHLIRTGATGNLSRLARTSEDLFFERFSVSGKYVYPNTSSLMFRREPVISRMGAWDPVRTGADTEFYQRMELLFGEKLEILPGAPLSLARTRTSALTTGTQDKGWSAPARRHYRAAWITWHRMLRNRQKKTAQLPSSPRAFPAPPAILPDPPGKTPGAIDIVIVADLRCEALAGPIARELAILADAQHRSAVCHMPALRRSTAGREHTDSRIQALINAGRIAQVEPDEALDCGLVLVRDPTSLQFADHATCRIRPQRVAIATERAPFAAGSRRASYAVTTVSAAAARLFGRRPMWATSSVVLHDRLAAVLPDSILPFPWTPVVKTPPDGERPARPRTAPAITGMCFPDANALWDAWSLNDARLFPTDGPPVSILGGRPSAGPLPGNWTALHADAESRPAFLSRIDFLPFYPQDDEGHVVNSVLAGALAAGCIVFAPVRLAPLLGEGALYADVGDVRALMDAYAADPNLMSAQSRKAREFAAAQLSGEACLQRVRSLLPVADDAGAAPAA